MRAIKNTSDGCLITVLRSHASTNLVALKKKCNDVTRDKDNNFVQAVHLSGSKNVEADEESRIDRREIEWKLYPVFFKAVQTKLGVCDNVDLFASRVNNQLDRYVAWQPDPGTWQIDAFFLDWNEFSPYFIHLFV